MAIVVTNAVTRLARYKVNLCRTFFMRDTINNPIRTRARGSVNWNMGGFRANVFVNYVGDYLNDQVTPAQGVDDWTTVDGNISYETGDDVYWPLRGVRFTVSATNLFNEAPPPVINGVLGFDSANASPLRRTVSFEISKSW